MQESGRLVNCAMRCAITLICSTAALQPKSVLRVEVPLRPSTPSQQQPLWDSPLSANDALTQTIPMLSSAPIETEAGERFRVDVYPRGNTGKRAAAVYLRYLSRGTGDDVDATFSLALRVNGTTVPTLSGCGGAEKGGAPMWRGAMTFCGAAEAVESCGRAADWGAHAWPGCKTGDEPSAVVEIATWSRRSGETSGSFRGALGAAFRAAAPRSRERFKGGEVLVPVARSDAGAAALEKMGLATGGEYRVMRLLRDDEDVFYADATDHNLTAKLRPAMGAQDPIWPVDVPLALDGVDWLTRFDARSFPSRVTRELSLSAASGGDAARGGAILIAWLLSAVAPIPLVLLARTFASLYVIPSESMLPTLQKGDVLLVAKQGIRRGAPPAVGDLIVFNQPPALRALVGKEVKAGDQFVKRVAGVGGDRPSFDARRVPAVCDAPSDSLARAITDGARDRGDRPVASGAIFVRGDCDGKSVDSRVFGDVDARYVVGKPLYRVWPLGRAGPVN